MTQPLGRRDRKKLETRHALIAAALELFAARGFDEVTVNDISEAADVGESTFFRHFPAKEAVLFADIDGLHEQIEAALLSRPAEEPLISAATHAVQHIFDVMENSPEQERVREMLMKSAPSVRSRMTDVLVRTTEALSDAIAKRLDVDATEDPRPRLLAGLLVQCAQWVRSNRLAHGRQLGERTFTDEIPKALQPIRHTLEGIRPIRKRKV